MRSFRFFCVLVLFSAFVMGCGRNLNLSIVAGEDEKRTTVADVVSQVDLSYRDRAGEEKLKESFPVSGLGHGKVFKPKIEKKFGWDKDGTFEARAFTSDGVEVLRGISNADPEQTNDVMISLVRTEDLKKTSAVIRGLQVVASKGDHVVELATPKKIAPAECQNLQAFTIPQTGSSYPHIIFRTLMAGTQLRWTAGTKDEKSPNLRWSDRKSMPILENGYPGLELGPRFENGVLQKQPMTWIIKVESSEYEGCVTFGTVPDFGEVAIAAIIDERYPVDQRLFPGVRRTTSVVRFTATNPLPYDVVITWQAEAPRQLHVFLDVDSLNKGLGHVTAVGQRDIETIVVKANSSVDWYGYSVVVFGSDMAQYLRNLEKFDMRAPSLLVSDLKLTWSARIRPVWSAADVGVTVPASVFHTPGA